MRNSFTVATLALAALVTWGSPPATAADQSERGPSGLPIPRFVSLASGTVNVRMGPSTEHKVKWIFHKEGLPVEVVREYGNWRRVRDSDGEEGWVHQALLSGRRTALVGPWRDDNVPLRTNAKRDAPLAALLQPFVLAEVERCDGSWCAISGSGWRGHVEQAYLWGVYPSEQVD